jgi:heptosyltransferase-3
MPPAARPLPADLAGPLGQAYVVVHAPSMWAYKQWPAERYVQVVRALLAEGHQVVLTGSGSDRDQSCIAPLRELGQAPTLIDTSGRLDFGQLRTLLEGAALYIGPDTSVSHLAAACGTPMVVVFGPTNPQRWAPWPAHAPADLQPLRHAPRQTLGLGQGQITLLQGPQTCVPCGRAGCEDHHHSRSQCLWAIEAKAVLHEARQRLSEAGGRRIGLEAEDRSSPSQQAVAPG